MKHDALAAWTSLYIAVGAMAFICATLAVIVTLHELRTGAWRPRLNSATDTVLALPKIWLRWQKNYLLGAPVILAISLAYAHHLGFAVFWNL